MPDHRLGRGDRGKRLGSALQGGGPRAHLAGVGSGGGEVAVDGVDRLGSGLRVGERGADAALDALGVGRRHAAAAAVAAAVDGGADHLRVDPRAALVGALEAFEQQHAGAGAGDEASGARALAISCIKCKNRFYMYCI